MRMFFLVALALSVSLLGSVALTQPADAQRYYDRCRESWWGRNDRYCDEMERRGQIWEQPAERGDRQSYCHYAYMWEDVEVPHWCRNSPYSTLEFPRR